MHREAPKNLAPEVPCIKSVENLLSTLKAAPDHKAGASDKGRKEYLSELSKEEYLIVRYAAVLRLWPMLQRHFEGKGQGFLEYIATDSQNNADNATQVFGVDLKTITDRGDMMASDRYLELINRRGVMDSDTIDRSGVVPSSYGFGPTKNMQIPAIMNDLMLTMTNRDLGTEGVFRKEGKQRILKASIADVNEGKNVVWEGHEDQDVIQNAHTLKKFLKEMPNPLLTFELWHLFLACYRINDKDIRQQLLHLLCCLLPQANRACIEALSAFCAHVASFAVTGEEGSGSKMDMENLALVISPNILWHNVNIYGEQEYLKKLNTTTVQVFETLCEEGEIYKVNSTDSAYFK